MGRGLLVRVLLLPHGDEADAAPRRLVALRLWEVGDVPVRSELPLRIGVEDIDHCARSLEDRHLTGDEARLRVVGVQREEVGRHDLLLSERDPLLEATHRVGTVEGPGLDGTVVRPATVDEHERELVVRVRETVDLLAVGALEGQLLRRREELVVRPVAIRRRRDAGLLEKIEVDVFEPRHDPQRIRHDRAFVRCGLEGARVEVGALGVGECRLGQLTGRGVLQHVAAGGVEHVETGMLLQDRDVELLVRLGAKRAALDRYRHIRGAVLVRLHGRIGRDRFGGLRPRGVIAPPPLDADRLWRGAAARSRTGTRARCRGGSACDDHAYRGHGLQETPTIHHSVTGHLKTSPAWISR